MFNRKKLIKTNKWKQEAKVLWSILYIFLLGFIVLMCGEFSIRVVESVQKQKTEQGDNGK